MHMADALLSPAVGGAMWAASVAAISASSAKVSRELDDRKVPLMGVLGAFLFAAQMINFAIPGTGSSGHLGGGLLLAILLGRGAALLTVSSVLLVQALFFADGGLLALGCNIFNLGILPIFVAFPCIYQRLIGDSPGRLRRSTVTVFSAVAALQLGAFAVVVETYLSGISSLPFSRFLLLMQPIHLAIGIVEGIATAAIVSFLASARPDILERERSPRRAHRLPVKTLVFLTVSSLFIAGVFSCFASKSPDGLEWSISKLTGKPELPSPASAVHRTVSAWQEVTAVLSGYQFGNSQPGDFGKVPPAKVKVRGESGTGIAGMVGAAITLLVVLLAGFVLKKRHRHSSARSSSPI